MTIRWWSSPLATAAPTPAILAAENDRQVTLRVVGLDPVVLSKSEIQSREVTPKSMMPEGLLSTMEDGEVIDLVAYLQSEKQVSLPTDD